MSQGESQLAEPVSNDGSDEAAMELLANLRKQPEQEETEEEEVAEEVAETEEETEEDEQEEETVEEDEDPEIDLGEIKLRKSELKAGYMKDADYRQKTAQVAEAKREAQAEREQARQERSFIANHVKATLNAAHKQLIGDQALLAQLAVDDPASWVRENAAMQERVANYEQLRRDSQALDEQAKADDEAQHRAYRQEQAALLQEKLPQWKDAKVKASESEIIGKYAMGLGYTPEELNELFDHRAVVILRDAAMAASAKVARETAKSKQVKAEPHKSLKPGAAVDKTKPTPQEAQKILNRARQTGSEDDWVALLQAKRKTQ